MQTTKGGNMNFNREKSHVPHCSWEDVNIYSSPSAYRQMVYHRGVKWTYGAHTIEIRGLGGNKNVVFDYFFTQE